MSTYEFNRIALVGNSRDRRVSEAMLLLARNGFDGFLLDDHVPHMDDDSDWNHRGRAHAIGYMQGLLRMGDFLKAA